MKQKLLLITKATAQKIKHFTFKMYNILFPALVIFSVSNLPALANEQSTVCSFVSCYHYSRTINKNPSNKNMLLFGELSVCQLDKWKLDFQRSIKTLKNIYNFLYSNINQTFLLELLKILEKLLVFELEKIHLQFCLHLLAHILNQRSQNVSTSSITHVNPEITNTITFRTTFNIDSIPFITILSLVN